MPSRRPRAVYEVYDAEEALGEQEPSGAVGEPVDAAPDPAMERVPALEPASGVAGRGQMRRTPPMGERWAPGRMLAGALLCTVAVCALAGIGIVLLHVLGGAAVAHRVAASPPSRPIASAGHATAPVKRSEAANRATALKRLAPTTPTEAVESARRVGHVPAARPIYRHDPAGPLPPGPDVSPEPRMPWTPPAPSPGCACATAEVEFGFER